MPVERDEFTVYLAVQEGRMTVVEFNAWVARVRDVAQSAGYGEGHTDGYNEGYNGGYDSAVTAHAPSENY